MSELITLSFKKLGASGVTAEFFLGRMRGAVDFDDEFFAPTDEVSKIRPDRFLRTNLKPPTPRPRNVRQIKASAEVWPSRRERERRVSMIRIPRMDLSFLPVLTLIVFRACDRDFVFAQFPRLR